MASGTPRLHLAVNWPCGRFALVRRSRSLSQYAPQIVVHEHAVGVQSAPDGHKFVPHGVERLQLLGGSIMDLGLEASNSLDNSELPGDDFIRTGAPQQPLPVSSVQDAVNAWIGVRGDLPLNGD